MARVNIENVTSTILETSYFETLATTELDTEKIDGETVVTDPDDVFIVRSAQIKVAELQSLLDSRLISPRDFAIRLRALSLAINPDTTDIQLYDALKEYDRHPAIVSGAVEMGKIYVVETIELLRKCSDSDFNTALCGASVEGRIEIMTLLKSLGASHYTRALARAAFGGHLEAMKILRTWGARDFNWALAKAAAGGRLKAMKLLKDWGASDYNWALCAAEEESHVDAINLLNAWASEEELFREWLRKRINE